MTIKTKYDVDDIVWFMKNNKITSAKVSSIKISFIHILNFDIFYNATDCENPVTWLDHVDLR